MVNEIKYPSERGISLPKFLFHGVRILLALAVADFAITWYTKQNDMQEALKRSLQQFGPMHAPKYQVQPGNFTFPSLDDALKPRTEFQEAVQKIAGALTDLEDRLTRNDTTHEAKTDALEELKNFNARDYLGNNWMQAISHKTDFKAISLISERIADQEANYGDFVNYVQRLTQKTTGKAPPEDFVLLVIEPAEMNKYGTDSGSTVS